METDDSEFATRPEDPGRRLKSSPEFAHLVIDMDSQGLKCPGGLVNRAGPPVGQALFDQCSQGSGSLDWLPGPRFDDLSGNAHRLALLTILTDHPGKGSLRCCIDKLGRCDPDRIHAHVERTILPKGKSPMGRLKLHRRDAKIEDDAING